MESRKKEFAKFFAGVASLETVLHWTLGFAGEFPITVAGFTLTPATNTAGMVVWPVVAALLVYYAWVRGTPRADGPRS